MHSVADIFRDATMNPKARPLIRLIARKLVEDFLAGRLSAEPNGAAPRVTSSKTTGGHHARNKTERRQKTV